MYKRIYIVGSVGSGKTTLARKLSNELKVPSFELDDVVWIRNNGDDIRRPNQERDKLFSAIIESEKWIIEDGGRPCFSEGLKRCDLIIVLDRHSYIIKYRIFKRWLFQNLRIERSHYKPTLSMLSQMFKWSKGYQTNKAEKMQEWEQFGDKLLVIHGVRQIDSCLTK